MALLSGKLSADGLTFEAMFVRPDFWKHPPGSAGDRAMLATVLLDTGASHTVVTKAVVDQLVLSPVGASPITTPGHSGGDPAMLYRVGIGIETTPGHTGIDMAIIKDTVVIGGLSLFPGVDCLLGRDLLAKSVLFYNGHDGTFTLCF